MDQETLIHEVTDFAAAHGLLMVSKDHGGCFEHAPLSLEATPFPSKQFVRAIELAVPFSNLVEVPPATA